MLRLASAFSRVPLQVGQSLGGSIVRAVWMARGRSKSDKPAKTNSSTWPEPIGPVTTAP